MGWDIYGGGNVSLHTRRAACLVYGWCYDHDTRTWNDGEARDRAGLVEFPAACVASANAATPWTMSRDDMAKQGVDERDFEAARRFLDAADKAGEGISGSY